MKKISLGILAHVDAGKTTLTESMLYLTGMIRSQGRVDNKDAFLDNAPLEKKRGVTIYSKQALIDIPAGSDLDMCNEDVRLFLIDTPGHADLVGETERAAAVLDAAILLISAPDGVSESTIRLERMLERYRIPFFVFVNKTDMVSKDKTEILAELAENFGQGFVRFENDQGVLSGRVIEEIAALSEETIEKYLEGSCIDSDDIKALVGKRKLHPVLFGAALKNEGVKELIRAVVSYVPDRPKRQELSGYIYKISYDGDLRLSHIKLTGGTLSVRDVISDDRLSGQKITQIRIYNGEKYENVKSISAGDVAALAGLNDTFAGMGIGDEPDSDEMVFRPVLRYRMIFPEDIPVRTVVTQLKALAFEDPLLDMAFGDINNAAEETNGGKTDKNDNSVMINVMGDFYLEILAQTIKDRLNADVRFDSGNIIYKETIASPVIGYGHFEPLRHYAEVHLLLEPLPQGSGILTASMVPTDVLSINFQKTIFAALTGESLKGVLTGSALTDIKITLIGGRSHIKHSESIDFHQAAKRALRQGLMKAVNVLLEPCYEFTIKVPGECLGRVLGDLNLLGGSFEVSGNNEEYAFVKGRAPASGLVNYQSRLNSLTSGRGTAELCPGGYEPCREETAKDVIENSGYDPELDKENISGSVFVSHGAGYYVPWYECEELMHIAESESDFITGGDLSGEERDYIENERLKRLYEQRENGSADDFRAIGTEEIDEILKRSTHANAGSKSRKTKWTYSKSVAEKKTVAPRKQIFKEKYLLVDGYNIIHAWDELKELLTDKAYDMDGAKYRLLDILSEYKVLKGIEIIVVFDAYKVKGHVTEKTDYMGVHVVHTKEAETADQYIARYTIKNADDLDITVATSDGLVQLIIRGENAKLLSARELKDDVAMTRKAYITE